MGELCTSLGITGTLSLTKTKTAQYALLVHLNNYSLLQGLIAKHLALGLKIKYGITSMFF